MRCFVWLVPALLAVIVLLLPTRGIGDEPAATSGAKYAALVQQLVSPNEKPTVLNRSAGAVKLPEKYDASAQRRTKEARQALYENFAQALPALVAALDDERYSMTIDWFDGDAYYNYSVGSVCENVIESHLEVYRDAIRFSGPQHWNKYNYPVSKEWFATRKKRSLVELQIEAIDWAAERLVADLGPKPSSYGQEQIDELRQLRESLVKSGKPAPPRRMLPMVTSNRGRFRDSSTNGGKNPF